MKSRILKQRPGVAWLLGLASLGLVTAYVAVGAIHKAEQRTMVLVAARTIPADTLITANEVTHVAVTSSLVPSGAAINPQGVIGKYADTEIVQGSPLLPQDIAPASTVRELVRAYGMDFVGMTIAVPQSGLPDADVNPGDIVDLVGVYGSNHKVYTQWIAKRVPVLAVDTQNRKLEIAVPRADALAVAQDLAIGNVQVLLDPRPFEAAATVGGQGASGNGTKRAGIVPTTKITGTQGTNAAPPQGTHSTATHPTTTFASKSTYAQNTTNAAPKR